MRFIKLGLEDESQTPDPSATEGENPEQQVDLNPDETQRAIDAVNNQESTEQSAVIQVANYKEELALLKQKQENEQDGTTDENQEGNTSDEDGVNEPASLDNENTEGEEPAEEPVTEDDSGDNNEGDDTEEESSSDAEPVNTDAEMGSSAVDKDPGVVAQEQYIIGTQKMVHQALESMQVMGKYHSFLQKRCSLGGISPRTAAVINTAFEHHAEVNGYKFKEPIPALESYGSYSSGVTASQDLKVAIEGFLESAWEAIKKFFMSLYNWVMDLLTPKKPSIVTPADKAARDKAVKELQARNDELMKILNGIDRAREKDEARVNELNLERNRRDAREKLARFNKKIAASLFKTSDKGSFAEISQNARMLHEVVSAAGIYTKKLVRVAMTANKAAHTGQKLQPSSLAIGKNEVSGIQFNQENRTGNKAAVYEAITDEILGGVGARFVFGGDDADKIASTVGAARVIKELGYQGFKMTSVHEKSGFPTQLPEVDSQDIHNLKSIVMDVDGAYGALNEIQSHLLEIAKALKEMAKQNPPTGWDGLSKEDLAHLQQQLNFVGLVETSFITGYKSLSDQVNNFKNSYIQLTNYYA